MKEQLKIRLSNWPNLLFLLLVMAILLPGQMALRVKMSPPGVFLGVVIAIEIFFLVKLGREKSRQAARDIATFLYLFLLAWEVFTTKLDKLPYVFVPAPENVFHVYVLHWEIILSGFWRSMALLISGFGSALVLGVVLGIIVGWIPRLRNAVFPIAKAISTVPAMIYVPYVVVLMPTFTLASIIVIFNGIFWTTFMNMINRVGTIDKRILDSAKILNVKTSTMLFQIILPYTLPRIINSLTVSLTVSLMTLTAAEMIGADRGMGYYVKRALDYANYTQGMAGIFFIALVITILNSLITLLKKKLVKWNY